MLQHAHNLPVTHKSLFPVNMPDPIWKHFRYGQHAARIGPDHMCRIRLPASFSVPVYKEVMGHTVQNWPGSNLDGLARVWLNSSGLKASRCAGIIWHGFWQDTNSPLPVSHFQIRFRSSTDILDNIIQNQPGSNLVLADCARFWPNGSHPEAGQCARIIRPASGQCFPADPAQMQTGCSMFTGLIICSSHKYFSYHVTLTWNVWIQLQHSIIIMTYN